MRRSARWRAIVHGADFDELHVAPEAAGLRAHLTRFPLVSANDEETGRQGLVPLRRAYAALKAGRETMRRESWSRQPAVCFGCKRGRRGGPLHQRGPTVLSSPLQGIREAIGASRCLRSTTPRRPRALGWSIGSSPRRGSAGRRVLVGRSGAAVLAHQARARATLPVPAAASVPAHFRLPTARGRGPRRAPASSSSTSRRSPLRRCRVGGATSRHSLEGTDRAGESALRNHDDARRGALRAYGRGQGPRVPRRYQTNQARMPAPTAR